MIVCKSREEVELLRRTAYLKKATDATMSFSQKTRRFLPYFLHIAPFWLVCQLYKYHARDL